MKKNYSPFRTKSKLTFTHTPKYKPDKGLNMESNIKIYLKNKMHEESKEMKEKNMNEKLSKKDGGK